MANYRSKKMIEYVRDMPCLECGKYPPSAPAHPNLIELGKGRGIKAHDHVFPLCQQCHYEFDEGTKLTKQERRNLTFYYIAMTYMKLVEEGKIKCI